MLDQENLLLGRVMMSVYNGRSSKEAVVCFTNEDLQSIVNNYCKLYTKQFKEGLIEKSVYIPFLLLACLYGFIQSAKDCYNDLYGKKDSSNVFNSILWEHSLVGIEPVNDLFTALCKIIEQQNFLSVSLWKEEFLIPYRGMEWKSCENQRMWRALRSGKLHIHMAILREAVLNEDWSAVGRIIGRLPAIKHNTRVRSKAIRSKLFTALRHNTIALGPYLTTLFCVGFQRFMQHNLDPRITTRSAVEFMLRLVEADYSVDQVVYKFKTRNLGMYYATEVLIFCIANHLNEDAQDLLQAIKGFPANSTVFRAYHALFMYNVWRTSETTIENELLRISDKLSGTVKEVPVGEERVFLDAAIHFLTSLGLPDLLFDIVCDCCTKNPFLVGHCFKMLNVLGNKEIARRVIGEFSDVSVLSPSDPILVDWIQIRLMDLELFDIDAEFFKTAAEMLCNFLDYGENRSVERAWLLLSACVRRINDTSFISSLWSERRTWWPQFHIDCLPQSADECRSEIMKIFEAAVAIR